MGLFAEMLREMATVQGQIHGHVPVEPGGWGSALIDCDPSNAETAVLFAAGALWAVCGQHWSYGRETGKPAPFWVHGGGEPQWLTLSQYLECVEVQREEGDYYPADFTRADVNEYKWRYIYPCEEEDQG